MRKRDTAERSVTQRIPRGRLALTSEEESRLGIYKRVSPTVEHDAGNIAFSIKAGRPEHISHLLANSPLVLTKRGGEQFRTALLALLERRQSRPGEVDEERENGRQIWTSYRRVHPERRHLSNLRKAAETLKP